MNKNSYTEKILGPDHIVDWVKELNNVSTDADWKRLEKFSQNWVTCACGNQCAIIPRLKANGEPKDDALRYLGIEFHGFIRNKDKHMAILYLQIIEERAAVLINKINNFNAS